ncbi:septum formation protein Maf [Alphaproteobacteria bacterium KMM 3653]|uniref:dTTP/UTP pyrophosphatase n=1 Tax=Harenicola maris TaxID=2841044 RepID=A0AAP2G4X9_9RHOB|nr:septum formation protein Maf [Harenicola maris]
MRLVLGSASPRRLELLAQMGVEPDAVRPADIDETPAPREEPRPYCARMAREKAQALTLGADEAGLTADTTVSLGRRIMGKPEDRAEAGAFLRALSGRRHRVVTAVCLRVGDEYRAREVVTRLKMRPLSEAEIERYLDTEDWRGKAGGYGIQGPAGAMISWIGGSYSAVVGLPLSETATLLASIGKGPAA